MCIEITNYCFVIARITSLFEKNQEPYDSLRMHRAIYMAYENYLHMGFYPFCMNFIVVA